MCTLVLVLLILGGAAYYFRDDLRAIFDNAS